uniref:Protein kinase domain-containing protein n=1 Tax=Seriola lalandi dorsalis TaxID=1841481 RepID=A0A3B4X934_SERLL
PKSHACTRPTDVTLSDIERCYEIGRVVGDGNFAVVRECRRRDNGQTLAIKIVERSKLIGREHMMQNELSLLGSLCHPRIVRLVAYHHTHLHSYLVMELVTGGDLFEAISERGKFSEAEAGLMVSDMSEALNYIHSDSSHHQIHHLQPIQLNKTQQVIQHNTTRPLSQQLLLLTLHQQNHDEPNLHPTIIHPPKQS